MRITFKLIILLTLSISNRVYSQTSILLTNIATSNTLAPGTVIGTTTIPNGTIQHSIDVKNVSALTKTIVVKRYDVLLFANGTSVAEATFNQLSSLTSSISFSLASGQSQSQVFPEMDQTRLYFFEADAVGHSVVKYTYFNTLTVSDSAQITFNYNSPVGLLELTTNYSSIEIFPNPVNEKGIIKINSPTTCDGKLIIYNSLGAIINKKLILVTKGRNSIEFNAENLPSGICFISINFGTFIITKKIVVE